MLSQDAEAFEVLIQDLCIAFNRPYTTHVSRVFWESLKHMHIAEVKRAAETARKSLKKFPTPKDLIPERRMVPARPKESEPEMSRWAQAANLILMRLAYQDVRRGFRPIAKYPPMPEGGYGLPLRVVKREDDTLLRRALAVKADYVRMAEEAAADGDSMADEDFIAMCREGFETLLGTKAAV